MNNYIKSTIILLFLDAIYINAVKNHFSKLVNSIQKEPLKINLYAVVACYIVLAFGFNYFIIKDNKSILDAFILGFVIYAVYDLTNMAVFKNWDIMTLVMDTLWGASLFGATTYIVQKIN